jgi:pSer/pThr/pTyr-binding forkhead associated (FHA) protein
MPLHFQIAKSEPHFIQAVGRAGGTLPNPLYPNPKMTTIGRAPDNAIVINNPHTSQYHCTIERIDGEHFLHDHSRNGSWLNGVLMASS